VRARERAQRCRLGLKLLQLRLQVGRLVAQLVVLCALPYQVIAHSRVVHGHAHACAARCDRFGGGGGGGALPLLRVRQLLGQLLLPLLQPADEVLVRALCLLVRLKVRLQRAVQSCGSTSGASCEQRRRA
jgi:hypothetical protein